MNRVEFIGQIIDVFEDFLEERGVKFPETADMMLEDGYSVEEVEVNDAIIYGDYYNELADGISKIMYGWGIFKEERDG